MVQYVSVSVLPELGAVLYRPPPEGAELPETVQ